MIRGPAPEYPPEVLAAIDRDWLARRTANPRLFDGPTFALGRIGQDTIELCPTSYRFALALQRRSEAKLEGAEAAVSTAAGVTCCCASSDGMVAFGKRALFVGMDPGKLHCTPSGVLDVLDVFACTDKELHEELGVPDSAIAARQMLGAARDDRTGRPDLCFAYRLLIPREEVDRLWQVALDKEEHSEIEWVPEDTLEAWAVENFDKLVPVARACIGLFLEARAKPGLFQPQKVDLL